MKKKTLRDYMLLRPTEYRFRLKTTFPLLEEHVSLLETILQRYEIVEMGPIKSSFFATGHKDFGQYLNINVHWLDFSIRYPVSWYILKNEIAEAFSVSVNHIAVRPEGQDGWDTEQPVEKAPTPSAAELHGDLYLKNMKEILARKEWKNEKKAR
jgi:hypothetical protein